jgi:hypothetical protein
MISQEAGNKKASSFKHLSRTIPALNTQKGKPNEKTDA